MFEPYIPSRPAPSTGKARFEADCREIRYGWSSDENIYSLTKKEDLLSKYDVRLEGVPHNNGMWPRHNDYRHTVTLTISAEIDQVPTTRSFHMLVSGKTQELDRAMLNQRREAALFQRLHASMTRTGAPGNASGKKRKQTGQTVSPARKGNTLEDLLLESIQLDATDSLLSQLRNDHSLADHTTQKILTRAIQALEKL